MARRDYGHGGCYCVIRQTGCRSPAARGVAASRATFGYLRTARFRIPQEAVVAPRGVGAASTSQVRSAQLAAGRLAPLAREAAKSSGLLLQGGL